MSAPRNLSPPLREAASGLQADSRAAPMHEPTREEIAEQSVLGGLLLGGDPGRVALSAGDFASADHARIFAACAKVHQRQGACDVMLAAIELGSQLEECGGLKYINALAASVPSVANLRRYAAIVRERAVMRRLREASTVADARALLTDHGDHEAPSFAVVDLDLDDDEAQQWVWQGIVPQGHITLLAGHGGAGKSTLALQLATCAAAGVHALGRSTQQSSVLFVTGEDSGPMIRKRLRRICRRLGLDHDQVATWLTIIDATASPELFVEARTDGVTRGVETAAYAKLRDHCAKHKPEAVFLDGASDFYAASENDRASVRAFMRAIGRLAPTVILTAHTDKMTARAGAQAGSQSYSGSTAWHNAARSRLFLLRDDNRFELRHEKCNVGRLQPPMRLRWPDDGVIELDEEGAFTAGIERRSDTLRLISLIAEFSSRGEHVSTASTGPGNGVRLLATDPDYPRGLKPADAVALLRTADRDGLLIRETYTNAARKAKERWTVTTQGLQMIAAPVAPVAPVDGTGATRAEARQLRQFCAGGVGERSARRTGAEGGS